MVENKKLSPKLDVVFHMLFGQKENEKITKGLIETTERKNILTNDLELHIIEMMKKNRNENGNLQSNTI